MSKTTSGAKTRRYDFIAYRTPALLVSAILVLLSIASLAIRGLPLGIDFTGGTLVEVGYDREADLNKVRQQLTDGGFADAVVQYYGTLREVLVQLPPMAEGEEMAKVSEHVLGILQQGSEAKVTLHRVEFVGPQVGDELATDGILAVIYAMIGILLYVSLRFEFRFALGAVAALIHDVVITLGFFSLAGIEFNLTVLAAVLALIGYSVNDTIVVFDRIRENFRRQRKGSVTEIVNISLNQTLSRTLMTSGYTMLVVLALFFVGGEVIHGFALALIIGIVVGTYSSIFVASALALLGGVKPEDLQVPEKEGTNP